MSELSTHEVLVKARELIVDPERWTQHRSARKKQGGKAVFAYASEARCWCAGGAIDRVTDGDWEAHGEAWEVMCRVAREMGVRSDQGGEGEAARLNDRKPRAQAHAEVLAAFDRAIAATEPQA